MVDMLGMSPGGLKSCEYIETLDELENELLELEMEGLLDSDYSIEEDVPYDDMNVDDYADIYEDGADADYSWLEIYYLNGCFD